MQSVLQQHSTTNCYTRVSGSPSPKPVNPIGAHLPYCQALYRLIQGSPIHWCPQFVTISILSVKRAPSLFDLLHWLFPFGDPTNVTGRTSTEFFLITPTLLLASSTIFWKHTCSTQHSTIHGSPQLRFRYQLPFTPQPSTP